MARTPDFRKNKTLSDLVSEGRRPQKLPDTGWMRVSVTEFFEGPSYIGGTEAVFQTMFYNSTQGDSLGFGPVSWYLSEDGEVRLRGRINKLQKIEEYDLIFTLPPEVRPQYAETFICPVDSNGDIDLSGIKFRAYENGGV